MKKIFSLILTIFLAWQLNAQSRFDKQTLVNINGDKITVGSFLNAYNKNIKTDSTTSIREYLNLYIDFRLKVIEAEQLKMDTLGSFKKELARYRKELALPYFENRKIMDSLVKQAWQREQYDIRASHILIRLASNAPPADTLKAWNKIMEIRKEILNGMSFASEATKYSEDPSAKDQKEIPGRSRARKGNRGDLGYFSVFNMIYPFENAAYATPKGQISMPIRTIYGYHLLKVTDKRPAMGTAQVEHIFFALPPNSSKSDSLKQLRQINAVYQKIKSGMSFEEAARKFSEDKGSSIAGGKLPPFTSNRIVPEFVQAVDTLKPGEVSEPFQTIYGFHIIKLLNRKKPGSFKDEEDQIRQKITTGKRHDIARKELIKELSDQYHTKILEKNKEFIINLLNQTPKLPNNLISKEDSSRILFELGNKELVSYNCGEFVWFVRNKKQHQKGNNTELNTEMLFTKFLDDKILSYYNDHLEQEFPEFKSLMQEYHDGILLFNLTSKKVWNKAPSDTLGLKKYFTEHRNKYIQNAGVKAIIFTAPKYLDTSMQQLIKSYPDGRLLKQAMNTGKIKNSDEIKIISDVFHKGDNKIIDNVNWNKGWSVAKPDQKNVNFVYISEVLTKRPKTYNEALGQVIADYQDVLQNEWVKNLRNKYTVQINEKALEKLIRKYRRSNSK
ncbi:MAG: peptidylprolyl isomerase [Bacteroidales bacterium]|nr:peptidylprolyl isomerase [Bacteroidales bacterium]